MIPIKGELRYFLGAADQPHRHGSINEIYGTVVMQIFDGAEWINLESSEGLAVVNAMVRMLTEDRT